MVAPFSVDRIESDLTATLASPAEVRLGIVASSDAPESVAHASAQPGPVASQLNNALQLLVGLRELAQCGERAEVCEVSDCERLVALGRDALVDALRELAAEREKTAALNEHIADLNYQMQDVRRTITQVVIRDDVAIDEAQDRRALLCALKDRIHAEPNSFDTFNISLDLIARPA